MIVNQELKLAISMGVTRNSYGGLTSGRADDISFEGSYIFEDKEDTGPRS